MPNPGVWVFCLGPPCVVLQEKLENGQKRERSLQMINRAMKLGVL